MYLWLNIANGGTVWRALHWIYTDKVTKANTLTEATLMFPKYKHNFLFGENYPIEWHLQKNCENIKKISNIIEGQNNVAL